jgi:hypothetical protein
MYIHTVVSVSIVFVVGIIAGSLDYTNYLETKSNVCTESVKIIESSSSEITCKNGNYEVFRLSKANLFMAHCSCVRAAKPQQEDAASCAIPDTTHPDLDPMLKTKPQQYGLTNTNKLF